MGLRAKHANATGKHKWHWLLKDGNEFSRDGSGRLVYKFQLIDRENDYYCEVVLDAKTREVHVAQSHPLSAHVGHGSAKRVTSSIEVGIANEDLLNAVLLWLAQEAEESGEGFHHQEDLIRSAQSEGTMLCAVMDGQAVGFLTFSRKDLSPTAAIDLLEVHPDHRRKGIGKRLANFGIALLSSEGREAVTVMCAPRSSEAFWRALDFTLYGPEHPHHAPRLSLTLVRAVDSL
jgi:predicted N-acetyltransferase YhbS